MFKPEVITGPQGGFIPFIFNMDNAFEIHAMGDIKNREFHSRPAAQKLAEGHAAHVNAGFNPDTHSSFVRKHGNG